MSRTLVVIGAASALALSACGGGSPTVKTAPTSAASSSPSTTTAAPTESAPTPSATTEEPVAAPTADPSAESTNSCEYLLDPHYRFVGQAEITNTGNIDLKVEAAVVWKQVGAQAIKKTKSARINVGQTKTVDFDVKATQAQIDQIQAYSGDENCTVTTSMVDTYGAPREK